MNGLKRLKNALKSPSEEQKIALLFNFECCGTCAGYRIATEDFSPNEWYLWFNEQTGERAHDTSKLEIKLNYFGEDKPANEPAVRASIVAALLEAGYVQLPGDAETPRIWEHERLFNLNTFREDEDGFIVFDFFPSPYKKAKKKKRQEKKKGKKTDDR